MNNKPYTIFSLFIISFILSVNLNAKKLSKTDLSSMYTEHKFTGIDAVVYHTTDDTSTVFININLHHLHYLPIDENHNIARFRIQYELYESYNSKLPIDSSSSTYNDSLHFGEEMQLVVDFDIGVSYPNKYILMIILTDLNKNEDGVISLIDIDKTNRYSAQNFFLSDENEFPLFGKYILENNYFKIQYNNPDTTQLVIRYYNKSFPLAKPPFSVEKNITYTFEPDSFFMVTLENGLSPLLELPYHGIYHLQADIKEPQGLTMFRFDDGFPDVSIPAQALAPLRYLSTEREFERLLSYSDYKMAVDSFWLERSSSKPDRAKNMIKRYYSRVQEVNRVFSSFQEGWKTDRGLIYIIYGPPSEVYRKDEEEEWVYGERGNPMSIKFYFYKVENPFTDNDYSLQRSPIYKTSWYVAIENWRR